MIGVGNLWLGGSYEVGILFDIVFDVSVKMLDVENGCVQFFDMVMGYVIVECMFDSSCVVDFGGVQVVFSGVLDDGDEFCMVSNVGFVGDSWNVNVMVVLWNVDLIIGKGGFGCILVVLQVQKGVVVVVVNQVVIVVDVICESVEKVYVDCIDVNLDVEVVCLIDQ